MSAPGMISSSGSPGVGCGVLGLGVGRLELDLGWEFKVDSLGFKA